MIKQENTPHPKDAQGIILHEQDRVYGYDYTDAGLQRIYGTLTVSDDSFSFGCWCIDYDDGVSFIVFDFTQIWKA